MERVAGQHWPVGIFLGVQVPPSWALDFTLALTFIALLVPVLTDRPSVAAAFSAGIIALIGAGWPYKLGLVTAALVGIVVGVWLDRDCRWQVAHKAPEQIPLPA